MNQKPNRYLLPLFFIILFQYTAQAQIQITNLGEVEKIKAGTTYVALNNDLLPEDDACIKAIKEAWTLSRLEFIRYSDLDKYLVAGNSFLTITEANHQVRSAHNSSSITHIYLELWTCSDRYLKSKKKKELKENDKLQVARVELYTDYKTFARPETIYEPGFDYSAHIRNWSPGLLKNYIQFLTTRLNTNKIRDLYQEMANPAQLARLQKGTLYVPDYVLIHFNPATGKEEIRDKEESLFEDYKGSYKLLPKEKLSDHILSSQEDIFYLVYVKSSANKFVSVVNSRTGEIVYSNYRAAKYNLKPDDLKDLYKRVRG